MRIAVAIDFDGTIANTSYPAINFAYQNAIDFIHECNASGIAVILWTCRTGKHLEDALWWCKAQRLYFDAVNNNLDDWVGEFYQAYPDVHPDCRKIAANVYIDDKANGGDINWQKIKDQLNILMKEKQLYNGCPSMP